MLFVVALIISSCKQQQQSASSYLENARADEEPGVPYVNLTSTENYYGTYEGLVPAATGPGLRIIITLYEGDTYRMVTDYIDIPNSESVTVGSYTLEDNIISIHEKDNVNYYFKIGYNQLLMLSQQKKKIKGNFEGFYVLKRVHGR